MEQQQTINYRSLCIRLCLRIFTLIAAILIITHFGGFLFSILLPFLAALLLAHLVNPVIRGLQRTFGGSRKNWAIVATTFIMAFVSIALTIVVFLCYEQVRLFLADWPEYLQEFLESLRTALKGIAGKFDIEIISDPNIENSMQWILEKLTDWLTRWQPPVLESAGSVLTVAANVLITVAVFVLASCYIMGDYPRLKFFMETYIPQGLRKTITCVKQAAVAAIGGYFKAQFILSSVVAAISFIVLLILRQRFAILFAVAICIIDFIPIFGSGTLLVPWAIILVLSGNYTKALVLLVLTVVLFFLRKLAEPRVLGDQTGLPTLVSLLCIYVGMRLGGVLGMIIAPVICLMGIYMYRLDLFKGTIQDCRILSNRISEILSG